MDDHVTVRQVMSDKPVTVAPNRPVQDVLRLMNDHRIGAVLVASNGKIEGIFTERDFLRQAANAPAGWRQRPVADWMTTDPHTVKPETGWEDAVAQMERQHVRHLPVVESGHLVGIVSARQLIARRNAHLNQMVEERTEELQRLYDQVSAHDSEIRQNMAVAGRLQTRLLLPGSPPGWPELRWGIHYAPVDPLGGDYYDFAAPDDQQLGILIADASGHSIPAAMVAIMARFAFAEVTRTTVRPAEVLAFMNRRLQGLTDERFVTAFYGLLDRKTREFCYSSAGHPPPLRVNPSRPGVEALTARGLMLGIVPKPAYEEKSLRLEPGDRLCLYTDGVIESRDIAKDTFGRDRLEKCLRYASESSASKIVENIAATLQDFRSDLPAWDDLTVLVAEVVG
jgi:serine phosphatase RsbU (regulator of sigma subunit)